MRTTLTLDDDAYHSVASLAEASGKRFGQVASELIRQALKPNPPPPPAQGLWFAPISPPEGTPPIKPETITQIMADEGA